MVVARLYIEGGGEGQLYDTLFRKAWTHFFEAAGLVGRMPSPVRGGGREQTFRMFSAQVRHPRPGELPLLLVDSEGSVAADRSVWQHLEARDGWKRPPGVVDDQAYLMVQLMETWFLADRALLSEYFGADLVKKQIPKWPTLEAVPKDRVLGALDAATKSCLPPYSKGRISFDLLGKLDPARVEKSCPHAKRLLGRLRSL